MTASTEVETTSPTAPPTPKARKKGGLLEWIWRGAALREARAFRRTLPTAEQTRLAHALTAMELGDRAFEPVDALRSGGSLHLAISLYREAAFWALASQSESYEATSLERLFDTVPASILESAAGGPERLTDVKLALVGRTFVETADLASDRLPGEARLAHDFVHALVERKLLPERRVGRLLLQRGVRVVGLLLLVVGATFGGLAAYKRATLQPDLALGKPWRASSSLEKCRPKEHYCAAAQTDIFFHTVEEDKPWVEIDLGKPTTFSVVDVVNRGDCCPDRAVPLAVEVSNDQHQWREVSRREQTFYEWRATFSPQTARYVRLRTLRRSLLHLELVAVRAR